MKQILLIALLSGYLVWPTESYSQEKQKAQTTDPAADAASEACAHIYMRAKKDPKTRFKDEDLRKCRGAYTDVCAETYMSLRDASHASEVNRLAANFANCPGPKRPPSKEAQVCAMQSEDGGGRYWAARACVWNSIEKNCECFVYDDNSG